MRAALLPLELDPRIVGAVVAAVALPTITYGDFYDPVLRALEEAAYAENPSR